jgi:hypothetical protein
MLRIILPAENRLASQKERCFMVLDSYVKQVFVIYVIPALR